MEFKRMTTTRIALATLAALATLPAAAQTAAPTPAPKAAAATPEERRAALQAMDSDKDGKLSKAEWLAAGRRERGFAMADANGDGFADQAELRALAERMRAYRAERAAAAPSPGGI
jgi:DMSO/TMAO reductase YedYZ molybdopterin-dependent catalytic subunit